MAAERETKLSRTDATRQRLKATEKMARLAVWACAGAALFVSWMKLTGGPPETGRDVDVYLALAWLALIGASAFLRFATIQSVCFRDVEQELAGALRLPTSIGLDKAITDLEARTQGSIQLRAVLEDSLGQIMLRRVSLLDAESRRDHEARVTRLCRDADQLVKASLQRRHEAQPEVQARLQLEEAIPRLRHLVSEADRQFEKALDTKLLKWWRRWTRDRGPINEIEKQIAALETALERLRASPSLIATENDFSALQRLVDQRLEESRQAALNAIPRSHLDTYDPQHALSVGMMAAAVSVPVSVASDLDRAGEVYDALREVNSNFADLSDFEIWQESLSMPAESLVGLASLTKGSYFERLVEDSFGGERFANFNHPDTDIVIDGVAYQIKATDSVSYVESVAVHIPVIATSEVAPLTGVINGGVSDAELSEAVELALGGAIIDFGDTVLDGLSIGFGGVGIVAILHGARSAWAAYKANGNAVTALGAGIESTAISVVRSMVNLTEAGYRGAEALINSKAFKRLVGWVSSIVAPSRETASTGQEAAQRGPFPAHNRAPVDTPSPNVFQLPARS